MTKRILCFGDSNTWGFDPATQTRFDETIRWPRVLGSELGEGYEIVEEGLCGRTTVWDDPIEGDASKNGLKYLIPCLESHRPLNLVIILLGTNDLKQRFNVSAFDIANGTGKLIRAVQISQTGIDDRAPPVVLLAPPPTTTLTEYAETLEGAGKKSALFGMHYERVAKEMDCVFLDTGLHIVSSPVDGIHFDAPEQQKLGRAVAATIRNKLRL